METMFFESLLVNPMVSIGQSVFAQFNHSCKTYGNYRQSCQEVLA
jgi:hypothetical protein